MILVAVVATYYISTRIFDLFDFMMWMKEWLFFYRGTYTFFDFSIVIQFVLIVDDFFKCGIEI